MLLCLNPLFVEGHLLFPGPGYYELCADFERLFS